MRGVRDLVALQSRPGGAAARLLPLAREVASICLWAIGSVGIWAVSQAIGSGSLVVIYAALPLAILLACVRGSIRTDPIGSASIAAPAVLFAVATVLSGISLLSLVGLGWVVVWWVAGPRIWPWWSSRILRRYPPGSAEAEFVAARRRINASWRLPWPEGLEAVWKEMVELHRWSTPRTAVLLDGTYAWWDSVWSTDAPADQAELGRLCRRLGRGLRERREEKETGNGATAHPLRLAPAL